MARARFTPLKKSELTPREECPHLVKNHRVLAYSVAKSVSICAQCEGHFIVTETGKATRKFVLGLANGN